MKVTTTSSLLLLSAVSTCEAFTSSFVGGVRPSAAFGIQQSASSSSQLKMIDDGYLMGAGIGIAGLVAGIGLVAFTEQQGERAKERGSGLSDNMNTQLSGMLMEDVEVSSVADIGSLTDQLEAALKASGGTDEKDLKMTEEEKKRIAEEADDGW
uniref:Uncharacterized protein n=1 Tax=Craspedostauros australis TaxID=1486917 RepID=A0A7R9ZNS2_9STRA|mmetsp:Transcript_24945/g.69333  ORF Transcript_24945/g.69333 Transcript_24945/m.69333 type:complete len:154 (+) Transcript_24945:238-699(+)|eukprot:CAMPEP_0198108278 /NCGR_PEP_ID=MMETSP1442-20131203/320_1 /TAXON_ID= /ORGANISM="Craspedostauros australis, Strain CCMP3328" /LENGTH=153 /DNA_ID=CAMNT_0043763507 /DNA_START=178 /DNA_END=639 /DNA_ORIENTATION=-